MKKEFKILIVPRIQAYYAAIAQIDVVVRDLQKELNLCRSELKKFLLMTIEIKQEEKKAFKILLKRYQELESKYKNVIIIQEDNNDIS